MIRDVANTLMNINSLTRALECSEKVECIRITRTLPLVAS